MTATTIRLVQRNTRRRGDSARSGAKASAGAWPSRDRSALGIVSDIGEVRGMKGGTPPERRAAHAARYFTATMRSM